MTSAAWSLVADLWARPEIDRRYGEVVTIGDHMLQTAAHAEADGAPPELVVAALLHDVGHLATPEVGSDERDRAHGDVGAVMLAGELPPAVTEPVRLHVGAKRFLVATDRGYADRLSPASTHTLALQGGPMDAAEQRAFTAEPHHAAALSIRRWDDAGKRAGREVPPLEHYRALVEELPPC